jgi:hypothetical protein
MFNALKGSLFLPFILTFFNFANAQDHSISISSEIVHVTRDSDSWFNASGIRFGYEKKLKKSFSLFFSYGKLSLFSGDESDPLKALNRGSLQYRIGKLGVKWGIIEMNNSEILLELGTSLRFRQEVYHSYAFVQGNEPSTSEVLVRTSYNESKEMGLVLGLEYVYKFSEKISLKGYMSTENYGEGNNKNLDDSISYSLITNGVAIIFNL